MAEEHGQRPSLAPLLRARSFAVVGASATPDTFGSALWRQLRDGDHGGAVYPVNPGRSEIDGAPCYPSLAALPEPVDCALLAVSDARVEESLRAVAEARIPAAVIFGGLPVPGDESPLPERLRAIAGEAGITLLGGNAMGFYNAVDRLYVSGYPPQTRPPADGIGFISHSGSTFSAFANNQRGLRFSYLISPGQELVLTAADFLWFLLEQPETRVVGLFLETVRDPERFVAALAESARRKIPVVVLKVGTSEQGRAMTMAHSGALAGSDAAFAAVCDRWHVIQVRSLDEMADTLELLAAPVRPRGGGLALGGDSGGERALIVDRAAEIGVPWAVVSDETLATIGSVLDPGLEPANPLDLWGSGHDWQQVYETCLGALARDPATGMIVLAVDLVPGSRLVPGYCEAIERVAAETGTPAAVMGNLTAAIDPIAAGWLREHGIPVLMGTDTGLAAIRHLLEWRPAEPDWDFARFNAARSERWREVIGDRTQPLDEIESKAVLADWGIPTVSERVVDGAAAAAAAAEMLGWPVVLKTAAPGLIHKSDAGGVKLGLAERAEVVAAYAELNERFGPRVVVQRHVSATGRVELFLGVSRDPQFGPLVTVGLGGIWVEVLRDVRNVLPPIDAAAARRLLLSLRAAPLLRGARGAPPVDLPALATTIASFSRMAASLGDVIEQIDVNPLLAGPEGVVAVDAVIVPRRS
ncbi:MAG: acetate--CoA ligase family protein [Thermomicrobiales bacterium]